MKHIAKRLLSLLLVVCLVLSVAVIPAGAAETKLTSVYASYAAEGHTNAPVADDVFEAKSDSITVSILTTTDMHGRAYDWNSYTNSALSNNFLQAAKLVAERRAAVDDSMELLREVSRRLAEAGYRLGNLDATIIAQRPKLAPYIAQMRRNIADALRTDIGNISVKATTEERLGFTGSGEGIAAHAVCLIE